MRCITFEQIRNNLFRFSKPPMRFYQDYSIFLSEFK